MREPGPYPLVAGKYVIDHSALTAALKITLSKMLALDSTAREVRADGGEKPERIAAGYDKYRDAEMRSLWINCGAVPPPAEKLA